MRISGSSVSMAGASSFSQNYFKTETLQVRTVLQDVKEDPPPGEGGKNFINTDIAAAKAERINNEVVFDIGEEDKLKISLIENMIKIITGKKIKLRTLKRIVFQEPAEKPELNINSPGPAPGNSQGWWIRYNSRQSYYEREQMAFSAQGVIRTADGREINFSVNLNLTREFAAKNEISFSAGRAVDPLVINFQGVPRMTDTKFSFDLDSDGREEQIYFVRPGSGFLALDLNEDGRVNDGKELFGPSSGNGFSELSRYDGDGNLWIDENDPIFEKLRVWTKDPQGNDVLLALGQVGVGAVYLGNVNTEFSLKNSQNETQAQIAATGIFVRDDGTVGTVQQIDLVV